MKKLIAILAIATTGFAACQSGADKQKQAEMEAQLQNLRMQHTMDSMNEVAKQQAAATAAAEAEKQKVVYRNRTVVRHEYEPVRGRENGEYAGYSQTPVRQKRGWSAKAKGAVIGAGAGALTGALVGHNRGTGALIGGGIGAAAGLGTGAIIDSRNGRNKNR